MAKATNSQDIVLLTALKIKGFFYNGFTSNGRTLWNNVLLKCVYEVRALRTTNRSDSRRSRLDTHFGQFGTLTARRSGSKLRSRFQDLDLDWDLDCSRSRMAMVKMETLALANAKLAIARRQHAHTGRP